MPARFDRLAAVFAGSVRRTFGERIRLSPQRAPGRTGGAGGDDPSREAAEFIGVVTRAGALVHRKGEGGDSATNMTLAVGKWMLWLDAAVGEHLKIRKGDHIERLDPPPGEPRVLRLSEPQPNDGGVIYYAEPV